MLVVVELSPLPSWFKIKLNNLNNILTYIIILIDNINIDNLNLDREAMILNEVCVYGLVGGV